MATTPRPQRQRPESLAIRIIREHQLPVGFDVKELARDLGAHVIIEHAPNHVSGALVRKGQKTIILANKSHVDERQRFSIAHELGHYLLHLTDDPSSGADRAVVLFRDERSSTGTHTEEIEANRFAASLLMPADEVRRRVADKINVLDEWSIEALAKQFRVSPQAMGYRLDNLRLLIG